MSAEDEQSQSGYEDGSGGPGAPTTLTALEVCCRPLLLFPEDALPCGRNGILREKWDKMSSVLMIRFVLMMRLGCQWTYGEGYQDYHGGGV